MENYNDIQDDGPIEIIDDNRCPSCQTELAKPAHTCPYAEVIAGDIITLCHCCYNCEGQCARDI